MYIRDLIRKKRDKKELTEAEMDFFIQAYNKNEILDDQASVLLMLMNINGLSLKEMIYMVKAMADTGMKYDMYEINNKSVDIHAIGGVDDKVILIALAVLNSFNLPAVKIISREIGIKDKLLGAKIYSYNNDREIIKSNIKNNIITFIEENSMLSPVEEKLYKLRNNIACNSDVSIIAASIMSQKISLGFKNIIFDISYGDKTYVRSKSDAKKLAKYLIKIGQYFDIKVKCIITNLNEPIGRFVGNSLEMKEIINSLDSGMTSEMRELIVEISNIAIQMETGNFFKSYKKEICDVINKKTIRNIIINYFKESINNSIGNSLTKANNIIPVMSQTSGYIEEIDVSAIKTLAHSINAIRYQNNESLDMECGIELCKKVGDSVGAGEVLGYIYLNDETKTQKSVASFRSAFIINSNIVKRKKRITNII